MSVLEEWPSESPRRRMASWMGQTIAPPSFQIAKLMSPHPGHSSLPSHLF